MKKSANSESTARKKAQTVKEPHEKKGANSENTARKKAQTVIALQEKSANSESTA